MCVGWLNLAVLCWGGWYLCPRCPLWTRGPARTHTSCRVCFSLPQLMAFPYMLSIFLGNTIAQLTPYLTITSLFSTNRCRWQILTPPQYLPNCWRSLYWASQIGHHRTGEVSSHVFFKGASPLHSENLQECSSQLWHIFLYISESQLCSYVSFLANWGVKA